MISPVSDTNGPAPIVSNGRVGGPSSDWMRDPWTSGSASGNPGVKYGRSVRGRRVLR